MMLPYICTALAIALIAMIALNFKLRAQLLARRFVQEQVTAWFQTQPENTRAEAVAFIEVRYRLLKQIIGKKT